MCMWSGGGVSTRLPRKRMEWDNRISLAPTYNPKPVRRTGLLAAILAFGLATGGLLTPY
jgi:hypothetical protein